MNEYMTWHNLNGSCSISTPKLALLLYRRQVFFPTISPCLYVPQDHWDLACVVFN
jgi:hypothetical protein